jgi:ATP-dependent RNA helicase HelY
MKLAMNKLRPGDVIFVPAARRRGLAVVLNNRDGKPTVFAQDRKVFKLRPDLFREPPQSVTRIQLPRSGSARSAGFRRDLAGRLVALDIRPPTPEPRAIDERAESRADALERKAGEHPCHACPDRPTHERWGLRASRLEEQIRGVERRVRSRTETLARQFDRVLAVLEELGYVRGFQLLTKGEILARIYGEGDILVSEAVGESLFDGLSAAEVAALVSTVVYESRDRVPRSQELPTAETAGRYRRLSSLWNRIRSVEDAHQVELCRELEAGFAASVFHWAEGKPLEDVLAESQMAPGDFVRNCKLLVDLLRQIEDVAPQPSAELAREARETVNRGVVAYTGV